MAAPPNAGLRGPGSSGSSLESGGRERGVRGIETEGYRLRINTEWVDSEVRLRQRGQ